MSPETAQEPSSDVTVKAPVTNAANDLDKRPTTIEGLFDNITPSYDALNRIMSLSIDLMWRKQALDELDIKEGDLVLDIATGTGDMAIQAAPRERCSIVGIDLSRNMLLLARKKWGKRDNGTAYPLMQGDALNMPFKDGCFDKAMIAYGIRNVIDVDGFLREAGRVLRPGGKMAILELSVPICPITRSIYLTYLTKILPVIGGMHSGNLGAYEYLRDSILTFPEPGTLEEKMRKQGFKVVGSIPQTMGICHLYILVKEG